MTEQTDKASRLSRMVQSLHATQSLPQSPSARTLTDVLVTLAEEILTLREEVQARAAAPADLQETQALHERLAAVERELHALRSELQRLVATTPANRPLSESPESLHGPAGVVGGPVTLISDRRGSGSVGEGTPLSHGEMVRRLSMYRDGGESDSRATQEHRPTPAIASYTPSLRDRLLLTLVPVVAIIVMIILFAIAASRMLTP